MALSWQSALILSLIVGSIVLAVLVYLRSKQLDGKKSRVVVLVLGDIGRSPRMQYHAVSLAKAGKEVYLVGYSGTEPIQSVKNEARIKLRYLPTPQKLLSSGSRVQYLTKAVLRSAKQILQILKLLLLDIPSPYALLVQNPPAVPTLLIGHLVALLVNARLIVDWHNFGFSIMALNLGSTSKIVQLARRYEIAMGQWASTHICVSNAMCEELRDEWRVSGTVVTMYDRSPEHFRRRTTTEIHEFLARLQFIGSEVEYIRNASTEIEKTLFTRATSDGVQFKPNRPALLVSSTSWTEDEDFGILLDALRLYELRASESHSGLPPLVMVITGKGPLQATYKKRIQELGLKKTQIKTAWLQSEDYPSLLGSADLGISLHTSSSGFDLPMKIVDMFGCGLPVCAYDYPCLTELVKQDVNGCLFRTSDELCQQIMRLLANFQTPLSPLEHLRAGTRIFQARRWEEEWQAHVQPLFVTQ
ncbi:mannosyltransferase [Gaertneriomyces sp. JEL0708]|nr:mannosyltransferase [Gaertneriomyces sp. JEL0708]